MVATKCSTTSIGQAVPGALGEVAADPDDACRLGAMLSACLDPAAFIEGAAGVVVSVLAAVVATEMRTSHQNLAQEAERYRAQQDVLNARWKKLREEAASS